MSLTYWLVLLVGCGVTAFGLYLKWLDSRGLQQKVITQEPAWKAKNLSGFVKQRDFRQIN